MNYVLSLMKEIIRKRKFIWDLGKADFRRRFVGFYFGVVWMFIQPIVTVSTYVVVFGVDSKFPPLIEGFTCVEWLVPGTAPWFFFSESVNSVTNCSQEYNYLVKKVVSKVEILPIIKLISCLLVYAFFVVIMFGMCLIIGRMSPVIWFQLVYYSLAASLLVLGIGFLTSTVNVFFKDMARIVSICLQFGIQITPIMYHESMLIGAGKWVEALSKLNPSYYAVAGYRDTMLAGNRFWERPTLTPYYWGFTAMVLLLGLKMFKRPCPHFSDALQDNKERYVIQKVEVSWHHREQEGVIPAEVIYPRRRITGLEIKADGHVHARVPERIPNQYVMDFIKERQEWIVQKWFMTMERCRQEQSRPVKDYEKDPELEKLCRKKAKMQPESRCVYLAKRMAVDYNRTAMRAAKIRWGSCSAQGNLNFHWKLVLVPPGILGYVVVHELAHRKEMNHSQQLWVEAERTLLDYKVRRKWPKEFGSQV